jgi:hypothetical protein
MILTDACFIPYLYRQGTLPIKMQLHARRAVCGFATAAAFGLVTFSDSESNDLPNARLIFLGTGSSVGIPRPRCLLPQSADDPTCKVNFFSPSLVLTCFVGFLAFKLLKLSNFLKIVVWLNFWVGQQLVASRFRGLRLPCRHTNPKTIAAIPLCSSTLHRTNSLSSMLAKPFVRLWCGKFPSCPCCSPNDQFNSFANWLQETNLEYTNTDRFFALSDGFPDLMSPHLTPSFYLTTTQTLSLGWTMFEACSPWELPLQCSSLTTQWSQSQPSLVISLLHLQLSAPSNEAWLSSNGTVSWLSERIHKYMLQGWLMVVCMAVVEPFQSFETCGVKFTPLPVMHGEDYVSLGFSFGSHQKVRIVKSISRIPDVETPSHCHMWNFAFWHQLAQVVYISDVSRVLPETQKHLESLPQIDILIVDSLFRRMSHATHFNLGDALDLARSLRPKQTYLIGLSDDFEHDKHNEELKKLEASEGLKVALSYDGLSVPVRL